jgi:hypothetical protein
LAGTQHFEHARFDKGPAIFDHFDANSVAGSGVLGENHFSIEATDTGASVGEGFYVDGQFIHVFDTIASSVVLPSPVCKPRDRPQRVSLGDDVAPMGGVLTCCTLTP